MPVPPLDYLSKASRAVCHMFYCHYECMRKCRSWNQAGVFVKKKCRLPTFLYISYSQDTDIVIKKNCRFPIFLHRRCCQDLDVVFFIQHNLWAFRCPYLILVNKGAHMYLGYFSIYVISCHVYQISLQKISLK